MNPSHSSYTPSYTHTLPASVTPWNDFNVSGHLTPPLAMAQI